jgi:hypothetical protein
MGTAYASGEDRALDAAQRAISSPLLEDTSIKGARGLLINITGGSDLSLYEVHEAASLIQEEAHEDANIIFGAVINQKFTDEICVTVIATGFGDYQPERERRTLRYSRPDFPSAAPIKDIPRRQVETSPSDASTGGAARSSIDPLSAPTISISEHPPSPIVETQMAENNPMIEAAPSRSASQNAMLNGDAKPVRRLGLVDERILDVPAFKHRNIDEQVSRVTAPERNGDEKVGNLDSEQKPGEPNQFADTDIQGAIGSPESYIADSSDPSTNAIEPVNSGCVRSEPPAVRRPIERVERRVTALLDQLWPPTKVR